MSARSTLGFPEDRWFGLWNAAVDRAKEKLTPEVQQIIKEEATFREDNLPVELRATKARLTHVGDIAGDLYAEYRAAQQAAGGRGGNVPGANAPSGGGYQAGIPGAKAANAAGLVSPIGPEPPPLNPQKTYRFTVLPQQGPHFDIELQALDRKAAWKKLDQQGGYLRAEMTKETVPEIIGPP